MAQHKKRMIAPIYWKTGKKTFFWVKAARPGRHASDAAIPLLVVIRDVLGFSNTAREAKAILGANGVVVDGKVCLDGKVGIGLMDTVSFPSTGKNYRALPGPKGLELVEIPQKESETKVLRVVRKTTISGGKTQITFHDGRNILLEREEAKAIRTGHSAVFDLKGAKVMKFVPLAKGSQALVFDGVHRGKIFEISEIKEGSAYTRPTVLLESGRKTLETLKDYVIAIAAPGQKPEITIPQEKAQVKGGKA